VSLMGISESSFDYPPTNERRCAFQSRIKYTSTGEHFYASRRDHSRFNRNSFGSRHYEGDDKSRDAEASRSKSIELQGVVLETLEKAIAARKAQPDRCGREGELRDFLS